MTLLFPEQIKHVKEITHILSKYEFALDLSSLGSGKTYTGCYLAKQSQCKNILIISPKCVENKWKDVSNKIIPENTPYIVSYNSLRSVQNCQPKHGYLHRIDEKVNNEIKTNFVETKKLNNMINEGLFVIMDEFQNLKNMTDQTRACMTIIKAIKTRKNSLSKILMISGSPFDKKEQIITFLRLTYIQTGNYVINFNPRLLKTEWKGMNEIYKFSCKINQLNTEKLMPLTLRSITQCHNAIYRVFQEIIKPELSHSMITKTHDNVVDIYEGFYHMKEYNTIEKLKDEINNLKITIRIDPHTGKMFPNIWHAIGGCLRRIEFFKLEIFIRLINHQLMWTHNKVVACFNFCDSIRIVSNELSHYNPLILNGSVPLKKRQDILNKFQRNDNTHRLLIGNLQVCSTGIDLDDKFGCWKRCVFASPTYNIQNIYQFGHRFERADTKSKAIVNLVFCNEANEIKMLNALSKKGSIMKETTPNHSINGTLFPGEYPKYIEPDNWEEIDKNKKKTWIIWLFGQKEINLTPVKHKFIDLINNNIF